jgi:hypothetical protein
VQVLYNSTLINQAGQMGAFAFQSSSTAPEWEIFENLSIRMAHSTNDTLGTVFEANRAGAWVEVVNETSYNISHNGIGEWIVFDLSAPFNYNGVDNLLIDIRWRGNQGGNMISLCMNYSNDYAGQMGTNNMSAASGSIAGNWIYNFMALFDHSANLTWSATSSDTSLFTAGVSNNNLVITPQADANGAGSVVLRLTNSNGEFATQTVPVTINAVNDAPVLDPLSPITCIEDVPYELDIETFISDIDDPIENMTVSTDSDYATVNGTAITFVYPEGVTAETVAVEVEDGSGGSATQSLSVTVTMVNDEPTFMGFVSAVTCDATLLRTVSLNPQDEESPAGQLDLFCGSPYANVSGNTLRLLYPKGVGTDTITIYLLDNTTHGTQNNVSYTMHVTIIDHPEVIGNSPEGTAVPVTSSVQVTFDMPMNRTGTEGAFSMRLGTADVNGTFSWNAGSTLMTFTPATHLTNGLYTVRVAASAETETGVRMLNAFEWNFTAALGDFDGDGDGMTDQWELDNGLDPDADDADADLDMDGLPNIFEFENGLDPGANDAAADADGDGYTNLEEYEAGTDPNDPESKPTDFMMILLIIIIVTAVAFLALVLAMRRKPKAPEQGPEPWQAPEQEPEQHPEQPEGQYPPPPPQDQPGQQNP